MEDYERVARIIRYLDQHHTEQPSLSALADLVGLSPFHFHRLFARWAGITPKHFLQCLTLTHAKNLLREGESVLDASLSVGLSGPGRLHDLCVNLEAASPGELKSGGAGFAIQAGLTESPFGLCLIGESPRGICHLSFVDSADRLSCETLIRSDWPEASIRWSEPAAIGIVDRVFQPSAGSASRPLKAVVRGTDFQVRTWRALLRVPRGYLVSYRQLAGRVAPARAARAVGSALGRNPLGYLIPCHRVIRETGAVGGYRWGQERKKAILAWEGGPFDAVAETAQS